MSRWVSWLGTYFGSGLSPRAPGTVGSLTAVLTIGFLPNPYYAPIVAGLVAVFLILAPWIADRYVAGRNVKDPPSFVLDEALGVWIAALSPSHPGFVRLFLAFVLFRLFDITKPWPIRRIENWRGGWGVVYDDVAAGCAALLLGHLLASLPFIRGMIDSHG